MRALHYYVDKEGKTQMDDLRLTAPLDLGEVPKEYHIALLTSRNARMVAELYKDFEDGSGERKVYLGCPQPGLSETGTWDKARIAVRRLVFENPHPVLGGLRPMRPVDYTTMRIVELHHRVHSKISELLKDQKMTSKTEREATHKGYGELDPAEAIATISAHPLWKRMSWIKDFKPPLLLNLIGELIDPTWYINPAAPERSGVFKKRCGLFDARAAFVGQHPSAPVWLSLITPFAGMVHGFDSLSGGDLNQPGNFFVRYGLRWMTHSLKQGDDPNEAFFTGIWHHNLKLINFIWLNWMECTHESEVQTFDDARFFQKDAEAMAAAYKAAVS